MIEVEHLSKRYGEHLAVDDLSFSADKGKIYGFLGPNGAGKSTTMNMMTGYVAASSGTVRIDGYDILKQPEEAKKRIGYLPEIPPVYTDMTVREYLQFAADLKGVPKNKRTEAVENALLKTGTSNVSERLIRNLSKGYRQRVGLGQAIINDPEVIILDEPTVGLDPEQQKEMFDYIRTLRDDHIVILSSHILSDINAVCDYVWIINKGKMIASDSPENLREHNEHKQEINIVVLGDDEKKLAESLRLVQNVASVDTDIVEDLGNDAPKKIHAIIRSDSDLDIRPSISQAVFNNGMFFLEMSRNEHSLEDVFLTLTEEDDEERSRKQKAADHAESGQTAEEEDAEAGGMTETQSESTKAGQSAEIDQQAEGKEDDEK